MLCQQNSKHFTKIRKLQTSPWDGCDDVATGRCVQGREGTPLPADKRKFDVCFLVGCGEREKTRNMYIAVITLFFVQLPNSPWDGSGDAATGGMPVCREGGSPPYLPSSENRGVIAWVDGERERKQKLTISTFLCSFQNRTILTRSLSPTAAILFLFIFCRFPALGRWRESAEEKFGISQKLVSFCIPLFVVGVNGVRSPHMFSRLFSLHLRATRD